MPAGRKDDMQWDSLLQELTNKFRWAIQTGITNNADLPEEDLTFRAILHIAGRAAGDVLVDLKQGLPSRSIPANGHPKQPIKLP